MSNQDSRKLSGGAIASLTGVAVLVIFAVLIIVSVPFLSPRRMVWSPFEEPRIGFGATGSGVAA